MKASILAVGTEITNGQIVNKNAAWISAQLNALGLKVTMHVTVPDDRPLILDALALAEKQSDLIFVTGGLGPTSDDFTRDLVSQWSQRKLVYHEESWQHIVKRLGSRGFQAGQIQKQQCYFPEGADVLINPEGTANGFTFSLVREAGSASPTSASAPSKKVFVLPGPPREIEAIWNLHIQSWMQENTRHVDKVITRAWDTIGVGESDVASKVEEVFADRPTGIFLELGYRVHLPYVEVKVSFFEKDLALWQSWLAKMDALLGEITIAKDFVDLADSISKKTQSIDFAFYDYVSGGYLQHRLSPFLKSHAKYSWKQSDDKPLVELFQHEENFLALLPLEDDKALLLFDYMGRRKQMVIEAPMKAVTLGERRKQYMAEMALAYFSQI